MVQDLTDLYRYVHALREKLSEGPDDDLALDIEVALGGTTSGEILGGLWLALGKVQDRAARSGPVESDLDDSLAFIREALGSPRGA